MASLNPPLCETLEDFADAFFASLLCRRFSALLIVVSSFPKVWNSPKMPALEASAKAPLRL